MPFAMTKGEREKFLADLHVGIVSIPEPKRGPLTVPIWYIYEPGQDVWMMTGRNSVKGRLLNQADRISLCVQNESPPYQYVSVEGPSVVREPEDLRGQLLAMATRYLGEEVGKQYAAANPGEESGSSIVSITPQRWYTVDYSKR